MRFWERGYGEIGRHARFRFWCRKAWEFKSLYPHQHCLVDGGRLTKPVFQMPQGAPSCPKHPAFDEEVDKMFWLVTG